MSDTPKTAEDHIAQAKAAVLEAAIPHVVFDGWSAETLKMAVADSGVAQVLADQAFPRGAVDLALAYHDRGDAALKADIEGRDLSGLRYSERVAFCIRRRLEIPEADKDCVRRGMTLLSLPLYASDGTKAVWKTCDTIWKLLGDSSTDYNWYTKRMTLATVYASVVVYWLGDDSEDNHKTWEFIDRRIANVMQFEGFKAKVRKSPLGKLFEAGPAKLLDGIKAPGDAMGPKGPLPGRIQGK